MNGAEIIAGEVERKVKILNKTKADSIIHFPELCSKEMEDFSLILSSTMVLCGSHEQA